MTPQSSFMVVVPIIVDRRDALETLLASMNDNHGRVDPYNTLIPFGRFDKLHSARLLIIDANTGHEIQAYGWQPHNWQPSLALLGEIDGETEQFLATLAVTAAQGLEQIYECCQGFTGFNGNLLDWLCEHSVDSAASYVNWAGRTVTQVKEEAQLHQSLAMALNETLKRTQRQDIRSIRQSLLTHVQKEQHAGRLVLTPEAPTPWSYKIRNTCDLVAVPLALLLLSPVLLLIAPFVVLRLRHAENNDPDILDRPSRKHIEQLSAIEDFDVSNQFNVFGDVKPGLFRYLLLKFILRLVDYSARHIYRRGFLARVRTIHFARWVFLNNNRSVYFSSLYDGSLESYMDDFINKVAFGLNLTFSHGVGYPRTRWLLKGGAELEQPFKDTLRRHQLPSAVWYHAHPGLTAFDMARNARIRQQLEQYPTDDNSVRQWLSEI